MKDIQKCFYTEEVSNTASSKKTTADLRWEISFCKRFIYVILHVRHAVSPLGVLGVYSFRLPLKTWQNSLEDFVGL